MISSLTLENLKSYADGCETVALKLLDLEAYGFHDMVVPSRGASPIENAASAYFHSVWKQSFDDPADRIRAMRAHTFGPMVNPLYLPFTADLPPSVTGVDSRDIRRFWTGVLAAIVSKDKASPYLRFYGFLRDQVCRVGFPHRHELEPTLGRKFVFLDTVVSGQAVHEIMDAFDEFGLTDCHFILVADANGERIKPLHRGRIDEMVAAGRATLIPFKRLFTEDQGPAVSGVWSVTLPELMEVARETIPAFRSSGAIGAGLYYHEVSAREDKTNLAATVSIGRLASLKHFVWSPYIRDDAIEHELGVLRDHLRTNRILRPNTTLAMAEPVLRASSHGSPKFAASSSHALRVHYSKDEAAKLLQDFGTWTPQR